MGWERSGENKDAPLLPSPLAPAAALFPPSPPWDFLLGGCAPQTPRGVPAPPLDSGSGGRNVVRQAEREVSQARDSIMALRQAQGERAGEARGHPARAPATCRAEQSQNPHVDSCIFDVYRTSLRYNRQMRMHGLRRRRATIRAWKAVTLTAALASTPLPFVALPTGLTTSKSPTTPSP